MTTALRDAAQGPIKLRVSLIYPEIAVFQVGLFYAMIHRGLDYITPPNETSAALTVVERALPFSVWGAVLLAAGAVGILGLFWARWPLTALAHGAAVAVYAAFSVGSLLSIIERVDRGPTALAWATCGVAIGASLVALLAAEVRGRRWRSAAWILFAGTVTGAMTGLAGSAGVYGWRTATDWAFVLVVAHAVMADASIDAWRDARTTPEETDREPAS